MIDGHLSRSDEGPDPGDSTLGQHSTRHRRWKTHSTILLCSPREVGRFCDAGARIMHCGALGLLPRATKVWRRERSTPFILVIPARTCGPWCLQTPQGWCGVRGERFGCAFCLGNKWSCGSTTRFSLLPYRQSPPPGGHVRAAVIDGAPDAR